MKNLFLLAGVALLCGCTTFEEEVLPDQADAARQLSVSEVEEPGSDPSSMEIMRRAVDSVAARSGLRSRSASVSGSQIEPTHRYVRFSPATEAQFDALFDQDEFTCYNFPLDEPSPVTPEEGFRMSTPTDTPEQLYAVLRTTVALPDTIAWEVVKELYDPAVTQRGVANPTWAEQVKTLARTLADEERHPGDVFPYTPSGEIKAWDNIANDYVPIEGAAITIMKPGDMLGALTAKTGKDGKFKSTGLVRGAVNYTLTWNTPDWTVKSSALSSANLQGPSVQGAWNVRIQAGTVMLGPATVYRAAYRYWNKMPALGLTKPSPGKKLKIECVDDINVVWYHNGKKHEGLGVMFSVIQNGEENDIKVSCARPASDIFNITAHELGHAAHFYHNNSLASNSTSFVVESWGNFTEYILMETEYEDLGVYDNLHEIYTCNFGGRMMSFIVPDFKNHQFDMISSNNIAYSPIFIDVYDDFNQYSWYTVIKPDKKYTDYSIIPKDPIHIPNISKIQEVAFSSTNKAEVLDNIEKAALASGHTIWEMDDFRTVYARITDESNPEYKYK